MSLLFLMIFLRINAHENIIEEESYWRNIIPGRVLIGYNEKLNIYEAKSLKELGITQKGVKLIKKLLSPLNILLVEISGDVEKMKQFIKEMEKKPYVDFAEPDRWYKLLFTPNDPYYNAYQYDKRSMNCEKAWDITLGSKEIKLAVIDCGVQYDHEDLRDNFSSEYIGYDFFDNDSDPRPALRDEYHGTVCSGIAGAVINNGKGIAGVANINLIAYRVGNIQGASWSAISEALQDAANREIHVLSMSLAGRYSSAAVERAIENAWDAGCLLFAAAGNHGSPPVYYPARSEKVIAISGINEDDRLASFSAYGPEIELCAPGVSIINTVPWNRYARYSGTSMACPNAAGIGALVWSAAPFLTNQQIREVLQKTAVDLGSPGRDQYYGYGKPDAYRAILEAQKLSKRISLEEYKFTDANNNGIWERGEEIKIVVKLKAFEIDFYAVKGRISTANTDVTITFGEVDFGTISNNSAKDNSSNPYIVKAKSTAEDQDVKFNLHVTADTGAVYSADYQFIISLGAPRFDIVDVRAKNALLSVTDVGSIGYDKPDGNGEGFIYPITGENTLCFASMAFGNSSSYIVDNWFIEGETDKDWATKVTPNGKIRWVSPPPKGDTFCICLYEDTKHPSPKNIVSTQEAWAYNNDAYGNFVVMRFTYKNEGSSNVSNLYSAIFADFDIEDSKKNHCGISKEHELAWICDNNRNIFVGVTVISPINEIKNLSTISNPDYIYDGGITDEEQFKFMNGELHYEGQTNNDFSVVTSVGPFDLPAGGTKAVVFAFVGGNSLSDIEANADSARASLYGVEESILPIKQVTFNILPTVLYNKAKLSFSLSPKGRVTISAYDIAGRKLVTLVDKEFSEGMHTMEVNFKKYFSQGVFFIKMDALDNTIKRKLVIF